MESKANNECMSKLVLSYNLTGGESYALVNDVDEYYNRLESLLEDIKQGKGESCNYLYFAFVSLASATLEYSLNLMLAIHCFRKFRVPMYEEHLQAFLDLKFARKIEITPEIVSEGDYSIKKDVSFLQQLKELVDKRHCLMHNSKAVKVQKFDSPNTGACVIDGAICIPVDSLNDDSTLDFHFESKDNAITTLKATWCMRMGNAVLKYRDCVVAPYLNNFELTENELLRVSNDK